MSPTRYVRFLLIAVIALGAPPAAAAGAGPPTRIHSAAERRDRPCPVLARPAVVSALLIGGLRAGLSRP
jgi:hypothetical protein